MPVANRELLKRAINREAPAIITSGEGPARRQVMIQFSTRIDQQGFWADFHDQDAALLQRMIDAGEAVVVWFQSDALMAQFSAKLLKKKHGLGKHMVLIEWPGNISIVEERHQPRWMVPASFGLAAKVQVLSPDRAVEFETEAKVWDIGAEGASIICPTNQRLIGLVKDAWVKVLLHIHGNQHAYPAMYRHMTPASDDTLRLGVQFIPSGDPSAAASHEALVKLIEELAQMCSAKGQKRPASHAA